MRLNDKIFVAGKDGVAGSAIVRLLYSKGYQNLLIPTHKDLDFGVQADVQRFFLQYRPDYVFYTAAKMGSITYRQEHPADILEKNLMMQMNILKAAHENGVKKLLFMSSDFVYPNTQNGILQEKDFLTGVLNEKDLPYTLAKIAGIKLCDYYHQQYDDAFFTVVPCAFYGLNASFDLERANVVASLIKRFFDAKQNHDKKFVLWGSGKPVKEFLFCDDVAEACVFLMRRKHNERMVNIGAGDGGITIWDLAQTIKDVVGFTGEVVCDLNKPDGIMHRVMDSTKLKRMGWSPRYSLRQGIELTYQHFLHTYGYLENKENLEKDER